MLLLFIYLFFMAAALLDAKWYGPLAAEALERKKKLA
jgi:uncharacterized protein involved in cysteine biosynthesis